MLALNLGLWLSQGLGGNKDSVTEPKRLRISADAAAWRRDLASGSRHAEPRNRSGFYHARRMQMVNLVGQIIPMPARRP
jgi:hypothetical protein